MPELALHLIISGDTDADAVAGAFEKEMAGLAPVEMSVERTRGAIGPADVIAIISLMATGIDTATRLVKSIKDLKDALVRLRERHPGVKDALVEVGLRKVPLGELTQQDLDTLACV
jgi:hypothetical protein